MTTMTRTLRRATGQRFATLCESDSGERAGKGAGRVSKIESPAPSKMARPLHAVRAAEHEVHKTSSQAFQFKTRVDEKQHSTGSSCPTVLIIDGRPYIPGAFPAVSSSRLEPFPLAANFPQTSRSMEARRASLIRIASHSSRKAARPSASAEWLPRGAAPLSGAPLASASTQDPGRHPARPQPLSPGGKCDRRSGLVSGAPNAALRADPRARQRLAEADASPSRTAPDRGRVGRALGLGAASGLPSHDRIDPTALEYKIAPGAAAIRCFGSGLAGSRGRHAPGGRTRQARWRRHVGLSIAAAGEGGRELNGCEEGGFRQICGFARDRFFSRIVLGALPKGRARLLAPHSLAFECSSPAHYFFRFPVGTVDHTWRSRMCIGWTVDDRGADGTDADTRAPPAFG